MGDHGDAGMVLERFSMDLVWVLEVMLIHNRLHCVVVVVVVEVVVVVAVENDDLQGLIATVFSQSLEFFVVVVSLLGLMVQVLQNVPVLGLDFHGGDHET